MWRFIGVWVLVGVFLALTHGLASDHLWMLADVPVLLWGAIGVGFVLWRVGVARERLSALRHSVPILLGLAMYPSLTKVGNLGLARFRFHRELPKYERIVSDTEDGTTSGSYRSSDGVNYIVDGGPPKRVAFVWPGGLVDNWCGVVHDPTTEVLEINDFAPWSDAWRDSPTTALFGGDMTSCRTMQEPYYLCCFT